MRRSSRPARRHGTSWSTTQTASLRSAPVIGRTSRSSAVGMSFLAALLRSLFGSRAACEAEVLFLRQQLIVLRRSAPRRIPTRRSDKLIFVVLYRLIPFLIGAPAIFKP